MKKTQYFSWSNDEDGKTGVVTMACKITSTFGETNTVEVRYHLTKPGSKFDKKLAKEKAKNAPDMQCVLMSGRPKSDTMEYISRAAWETAVRSFDNSPKWVKDLDLAFKAISI